VVTRVTLPEGAICVHKRFDAKLIKVPIDSVEQLYVMVKFGNGNKFILVDTIFHRLDQLISLSILQQLSNTSIVFTHLRLTS